MKNSKSRHFLDMLAEVPDRLNTRGKRHPLSAILGLSVVAMIRHLMPSVHTQIFTALLKKRIAPNAHDDCQHNLDGYWVCGVAGICTSVLRQYGNTPAPEKRPL